MQYRDELEHDQFDNYHTSEELNGESEIETTHPTSPPIPQASAASANEPPLSGLPTPDTPGEIIISAALQLADATSILITHLTGEAGSDKTIRQIKNLASSLESLQRIVTPKRRVGRPRKSDNPN